MTDHVGLQDLRKQLGRVVTAAEHGKPTTIVRNGRPVARIVPIEDAAPASSDSGEPTEERRWHA